MVSSSDAETQPNARRAINFGEAPDATPSVSPSLSTANTATPTDSFVTPANPTSQTGENTGDASTTAGRTPQPPGLTAPNSVAAMQAQIQALQQQVILMSNRMNAPTPALTPVAPQPLYQSKEYWARPICNTVYPGETAKFSAKRAYKQRLDAYLRKSAPIWRLVTREDPCPIMLDTQAVDILNSDLGINWVFDVTDLTGAMQLIEQRDTTTLKRVEIAMNAGSDTLAGSWRQRNSALYSTVSDTLDLSKEGSDLDILDVVEDSNGIALYELIQARLKQVQTNDPMARAIQVKMGIDHIRYIPKPHGVALYFGKIKDHRNTLANLPKPKLIDDWEVVAKALQDLPPLHPKFQEASHLLELQRQMFKRETSLADCISAFKNAETDNQVFKDLQSRRSPNKKRKLSTNLAFEDKRRKWGKDRSPKAGKYKKGDCIHHPRSFTHCTEECTNPFGSTSIFALAVDRVNKCAAVKKSLAAGWSPKATNVKVPEGYGTLQLPPPGQLANNTPPTVRANAINVTREQNFSPATQQRHLSPLDVEAYNRVRSALLYDQRTLHPYQTAAPSLAHQPRQLSHSHTMGIPMTVSPARAELRSILHLSASVHLCRHHHD